MPGIFGSKFLVDLELYIDGYIDGYNMMLCDAICKVHWLVETQTAAFRRFSSEYSDRVRYGQIFCLDDAHLCTRREGPVLDVTMKHPHHQPTFPIHTWHFCYFLPWVWLRTTYGQASWKEMCGEFASRQLACAYFCIVWRLCHSYGSGTVRWQQRLSRAASCEMGQPLKLGICESKASCSLRGRTLRVGWRRLDKDKIDKILWEK